MFKAAALVLVSIPVLLVGALASSTCVVVDVRQADGPRIIVPVPLVLARAALSFAPEQARRVEVPELEEYSEKALDLLEALRQAPDGVVVEVDQDSEQVVISKSGDLLEVEVHGTSEDVEVSLPLSVAAEVLASVDGAELEVSQALRALSSVSRTDLVHVRTEDEEVKVWVW